MPSKPRSCIVIGAGLAGLSAAYRLRTRGWNVTVLEALQKVGGRVCSAQIRWSRRIAHFQCFHLPVVSIRIVGRFNLGLAILLIGAAVRSCLIINPILFRVGHAATSGNFSCRS